MLPPTPLRRHTTPGEVQRANRSDQDSSQARLLRERGELRKTSFSFNAALPPPAPNARTKGLGLEVVRSDERVRHREPSPALLVAEVDNDPRKSTPVAEWNIREERQAYRSEEEQHASLAIKAGDRICAVNGTSGDDVAMAELLADAADIDSPKAVNIRLQRARSDVLDPASPQASRPREKENRSSSKPEVPTPFSRPGSSAMGAATRRNRSSSVPEAFQSSKLSKLTPPLQIRACDPRGRADDDSSTREPSLSLSGRSSRASGFDRDPLLVIHSKTRSNFSRVGLSTLTR